jgi:hypothetical protein
MSNASVLKTATGPRDNALSGANATRAGQSYGRCEVCGTNFERVRSHQRFCSTRCRHLLWAARVIVTEYLAGRLPGLEAEVAKLR